MLIDSHCHLDFPELTSDESGVLARARTAGVAGMLTIGTRLDQFERVRAIAERHDNVWCSVGVHPHEAKEEGQRTPDRLIEATRHPKVIGIGETGLDFYYEHSPREEQAESFRAHIAASRQTGLPLIVHTRNADGETGDMLEEEYGKGAFPGLIHCFSSGRTVAERALALGLYISISGIVTFKAAEELRAIVRDVPLDRLLVETDAPYLAPRDRRSASLCTAPGPDRIVVGRADLRRVEPALRLLLSRRGKRLLQSDLPSYGNRWSLRGRWSAGCAVPAGPWNHPLARVPLRSRRLRQRCRHVARGLSEGARGRGGADR
jgi:TatD DNase family protein